MMKQGNNHSSLLEKLAEAATSTEKKKVSFDETVIEALKQAKQPTLKDIIADVAKGKNVHKTAQWDSLSPKPMPEPPMDESLGEPEIGLDTEPGLPEDTLDTNPVEPEGDTESAKNSVAQALIDLCGSPEAACDCINALGGDIDETNGETLPDELGVEEPLDEELGGEMPPAPMEAPSAPMEMPSPM